ncbi:MAG: site-2 protease family protein [Nitrospirae bacterium]|jgi:Zn-dependent protease/CBS domain-containing protein|nr:site-2 protease family protein [Nitrospirota bacterium]
MNGGLIQGAWKIGTIMGIPIRLHFSWFIIFGLITWSLSTYYFPQVAPELPAASHWIKGTLAALLLFASVAFHELAHSYVAMKYKISIVSITLFIFGGVAQMKGEPPHPKAEFRIAIAGPVSSFFLAAIFFYLSVNTAGGVKALFAYLAQINFILGVFNLIPGFPMDGGRVLRSIIWERKKNFFYATRKASGIGQKIALFFIFIGIFSIFTGMPFGLWLMLIGWFLYTAAQASYQQSTIQETLSDIKVRDIMAKELVTVSPSTNLEEAVNNYFLRYGYGGFPVVADGKYLGMITLKEIKKIPRDTLQKTKVSDIYAHHNTQWEISIEDEVIKALEIMIREDVGRLVVKEGDAITGLITRNGIARYVQLSGK